MAIVIEYIVINDHNLWFIKQYIEYIPKYNGRGTGSSQNIVIKAFKNKRVWIWECRAWSLSKVNLSTGFKLS